MRRKRIVVVPVVPVVALALGGAGWVTYAATAGSGADYRTAGVAFGDVDQTVEVSGTVSSTGRADLAFGTAGEVAKLHVAEGDRIGADDVIAVLDRRELRAALAIAKSDLATAKAQLEADEDAQAEAVSESMDGGQGDAGRAPRDTNPGGDAPRGNDPGGNDPGGNDWSDPGGNDPGQEPGGNAVSEALAAALAELRDEQDAVTSAQSAASDALATADAALETQRQACADPGAQGGGTEGEEGDDTGNGGAASDDTPPETSAGVSAECTQALEAVQSAQAAVADAQTTLQTALETLSDTLDETVQVLADAEQQEQDAPQQDAPEQDAPEQGSPEQDVPEQGAPEQQAPGGITVTVTAATLANDQAAIDQAEAALLDAQQALSAAVVRAPAAGRVVSTAVEEGDDVAAGAPAAVVVGKGLTTVDVEVSATRAAQLKIGQDVEVTPAGADEPLTGTVSRIQNMPSEEESTNTSASRFVASSETTYPVTITLDETDLALATGMPADVEITVGQTRDALTVPTSAVSDGTVTVLENGSTSQVRVTTGIVGDARTEVINGLAEGDSVVLADLGAELPTGESQIGGPGGTRGFGGGVGFGGGPPPGLGG